MIEDERTQREVLIEILKLCGYEAAAAPSCAEGRELFAPGQYACALVDLRLPDGKGEDLITELQEKDPELVAVVLTADASAEAVIESLRAGAFDYLTKPVEVTTLRAALSRAVTHHEVLREREGLLRQLVEEREQLRSKVESATSDIRDYAHACEVSNTRLRALLLMTQHGADYVSEDLLILHTFETLCEQAGLRALVVNDVGRQKLVAARGDGSSAPTFETSDVMFEGGAYDPLLAEVEPEQVVETWLGRVLGFDTEAHQGHVFQHTLQGDSRYTIAFYTERQDAEDASLHEFFDMCAHFLAFEWHQGKLLLQIAHHASLGNIGVEMARGFVQPLTAIRSAAEIVKELVVSEEATEGIRIVLDNVERLRRQTQEFQKLALFREDAVETVQLDQYIEQSLDMLSVSIRNRNVTVEKEFDTSGECVLLNGATLARAFLDLILGALRAVPMGGALRLRLCDADKEHVAFEIHHAGAYDESGPEFNGAPQGGGAGPPGLQLARRTVHMCGGSLNVEQARQGITIVRTVLPRNATRIEEQTRRRA